MPKRSLSGGQEVDLLNRAVERLMRRASMSAHGETGRTKVDPRLALLLRVASMLRNLPREEFQETLRNNLERSASMATATQTPSGRRTFVAPRLIYKSAAKAIAFYEKAFGAKESFRFENEGGIGHAEIMIGDTEVVLGEEWPEGGRFSAETWGHSPVQMRIQVPDVDAFVEHAVAIGAKLVNPPRDQFYGLRDATLTDPFGYTWSVSTVKEEMPVEEMHRRFRAMMPPKKKPGVDPVPKGYRTLTPYIVAQNADAEIDFVKATFDAEETFRSVGGAGGRHCELRLGDSMIMIGGGGPGLAWRGDSHPGAFHVYVRDCDAIHKRAVRAGAASIHEPTDQPYGERSSGVRDSAGNFWYIATRSEGNYKWEGAPDVQPYLHPLRAEPVINFLKRAFRAEELGRHQTPDGIVHHVTMKLGDSHLEMGEAHEAYQPMASMFYLYVPDCDALYRAALAMGATSISEPKDQPYGDRSGAVKDAFGNQWYMATHIKDVTL
jgi:PhnB protein